MLYGDLQLHFQTLTIKYISQLGDVDIALGNVGDHDHGEETLDDGLIYIQYIYLGFG